MNKTSVISNHNFNPHHIENNPSLFFNPIIQPKLKINNPNDKFEQEADAVADKVMQIQIPSLQTKPDNNSFFKASPISITHVQRKCTHCEDEEKQMQRKEIDGEEKVADNNLENYVGGLGSAGQPLPNEARNFYEPRFGYDFSNVKVHTDDVAAKSAQSINALAYTSGSNIVFNSGQFSPDTDSGKKLLGHELTHVVQQGDKVMKKEKIISDSNPVKNFASNSNIFRNVLPPPPPKTSDSLSSCDTTQTPLVTSAITNARTWINNVEPRLVAYNAGTAPAGDQTIIENALNNNFHTTAPGNVAILTDNFTSLKAAFNSFLDIECVTSYWCEENWLAYVRGRFAWARRLGDVNLCPLFFKCANSLKRDSTIVHEVSHQYPGTDDNAYESSAAYSTLSVASAMNNAASYEVFTREVYYNGSHGPGESC